MLKPFLDWLLKRKSKQTCVFTASIPEHHSGVRSMMADAHGEDYKALMNFEEAKNTKDAVLILEGDWGGQIYLSCPMSLVKCSDQILKILLEKLDSIAWECNNGEGAGMYFEIHKPGESISGGMGGGKVEVDLWLHKDFVDLGLLEKVKEVLSGCRNSLDK